MEPIFFDFEWKGKTKKTCFVDFPTDRSIDPDQSIDQFASSLNSKHSNEIEQTGLVILRPSIEILTDESRITKLTERNFGRLKRRFPRAAIYILHTKEFKHLLTFDLVSNCKKYLPKSLTQPLLNQSRESELKFYAEKYRAVLPASDGFVYKVPSGNYIDKFLRVGNIQKNRQVLDAVFFWMLPYLKNCVAIVTDTWSISSIALNAARLLERYQKNQHCIVEMFSKYIEDPLHGHKSIIESLNNQIKAHREGRVLVLFSVVRSGNSLKHSREIFNGFKKKNIKFLAIYSLSKANQVETLCSGIQNFNTAKRKDNVVIEIDQSSYFPVIIKDKSLLIKDHSKSREDWEIKESAKKNKEFFDKYKGRNAVKIHRNVKDGRGKVLRHHAFYIEVESLLDVCHFRKKFRDKLKKLQQPAAVIVPNHSAGERLKIEAQKFFSPPVEIVNDHLNPETLSQGQKEFFKSCNKNSRILILDDVTITGERLNYYQLNLRELGYSGQILYLVGVARTVNPLTWKNRIKNLRHRQGGGSHYVDCVEQIVLPDWKEEDCPWCLELETLRKLLVNSDLSELRKLLVNSDLSELCKLLVNSDLVYDRRQDLADAADNDGLIDEVFWIPPTNQTRPKLTPGSMFLDHENTSEADVVAAVAGAIQLMRVETRENYQLKDDVLRPRVLSPENYTGRSPRFNDPILQLAILRSAQPTELKRSDAKKEASRNKKLQYMMTNKLKKLQLEFAIAFSQKKTSIHERELES